MTDFKKIAQDLIKSARGTLTQDELDALMKYPKKKTSKLETGKNQMQWREFVDLALARKLNIARAFDQMFSYTGDLHESAKVVETLLAGRDLSTVATTLQKTISTLNRWRSGTIDPPLSTVLSLIHMNGVLVQFIELLFGRTVNIPQLRELHNTQDGYLKFQTDYPEAFLVLSAMELKSFAEMKVYQPGWFAHAVGISIERETQLLSAMESLGIIRRINGTYEPLVFVTNTSWSSEEAFRANKIIKSHWFSEAERLLQKSTPDLLLCRGGYLIYSAPSDAHERILKEATAYHLKIKTILDESETNKSDKLMVMQYQFLDYTPEPQHD